MKMVKGYKGSEEHKADAEATLAQLREQAQQEKGHFRRGVQPSTAAAIESVEKELRELDGES